MLLRQKSTVDFGKPYKYLENHIRIKVKYEIPDYAIVTDEEIIFTPLVAANLFKRGMSHLYFDTDKSGTRNFAFRDRCSRLVELDETIKLPKGKLMAFILMKTWATKPLRFKEIFHWMENR